MTMSIQYRFASLIATLSCLSLLPPNGGMPPIGSALVPGGALSGVSVGLSSPAAGVRGVTYTVQFTASATGALAQNQGTITVAAAAGTVLPTCAVVKDITSGDSYSRCGDGEPGASVTLSTPIDVGAGHVVQVVFDDVTNTAVAGSHTLTVSTSSDAAATASYATVPGGALSGVSVGLSSPAAGVRGVTYTVQFTASATGALAQNQGTITVAAAAGTVLPTCAVVKDITSGDSYSRCGDGEPGASVTLSTPIDVGAGHVVQVVFDDVTNTAVAGSHTLTVSTSSDAAATASYATVPGGALSGVSVGLSSPAAGVRGVTYTVQFTASATGALAQNQGTITVAAAAGTVLPTCAVVKDITSGDSYSRCGDGEPGRRA